MGDTILDPEIPETETKPLPWENAPKDVLFYERIYEDGHLGSFTESAELAYSLGWLDNYIPKDEVQQSDVNGCTYRKEVCPMRAPEDIQREEYAAEIRTLKQSLAETDYKAIKYAEGDRVIRVRLHREGRKAYFETENDWARNVDAAKLDTLFDRFTRGDRSRSNADGKSGFGLGLAIARAAAEKNNAVLTASETEKGKLRFTLCLHC